VARLRHYQIQLADNPDFTGAVDVDIAGCSQPCLHTDCRPYPDTEILLACALVEYGWGLQRLVACALFPRSDAAARAALAHRRITVGDRKPVLDWDDVIGATELQTAGFV